MEDRAGSREGAVGSEGAGGLVKHSACGRVLVRWSQVSDPRAWGSRISTAQVKRWAGDKLAAGTPTTTITKHPRSTSSLTSPTYQGQIAHTCPFKTERQGMETQVVLAPWEEGQGAGVHPPILEGLGTSATRHVSRMPAFSTSNVTCL